MKNNLIKYMANKFFTFKGLIYFSINAFLILIVIICLTIIKLSNDFYDSTNNSVEGRTLLVSNNADITLLKSNEHIIFVDDGKYRFGYNFFFGNNKYIYIKPLIDKNYVNIIDGDNLHKKGEIICSKNLYPYEYSTNMDFKKAIDSKEMINTTISNGKYKFNVVGTFANIQMEEANTCYVSIDDFSNFDLESNNQVMITYDKRTNYNDVVEFLESNNISHMSPITYDASYMYLKTVPLYIMLIIIIIILNLTYSFSKKSVNNNNKNIGLLRVFGEKDKNIVSYYVLGHLILISLSIAISFILYEIIYVIIQPYLSEFMYYSLYVKTPIMYFGIFILTFYIYTFIVIKYLVDKKTKKEIYDLIESHNNS